MAFGRLERNPGSRPMADINMTPLIDVMLVLLVIFMITAPLMTSSLKLDLPKTEGARPSDAPQFIAVAIDEQGQMFVGDEAVTAEAAAAARPRGRAPRPADRGAAACRQPRALWPRGRAHRPGAGRRPVARGLRHRGGGERARHPRAPRSSASYNRGMNEKYIPAEVEAERPDALGRGRRLPRRRGRSRARSSTPARCCPTPAASCTWGMCATTPSTTCWRASCACRA